MSSPDFGKALTLAIEILERGAREVESVELGVRLCRSGKEEGHYRVEPLEDLRAESQAQSERFEMEKWLASVDGPTRYLNLGAMSNEEIEALYVATTQWLQALEAKARLADIEDARTPRSQTIETAIQGSETDATDHGAAERDPPGVS